MPTEKQVISTLRQVIDPHTNTSVYDMGLISELRIRKSTVSLTFRPTSPFCPLGMQLAQAMKHRIESIKGVTRADITVIGHVYEDRFNSILKG